jgi:hypothetical protein
MTHSENNHSIATKGVVLEVFLQSELLGQGSHLR